jgi:hypothetical protein
MYVSLLSISITQKNLIRYFLHLVLEFHIKILRVVFLAYVYLLQYHYTGCLKIREFRIQSVVGNSKNTC